MKGGKKKNGTDSEIGSVPFVLLAHFVFFLHVNELSVGVVELVLQERHLLAWYDPDAQSVFQLPTALQGNDALIDIGSDIGMDVE